MKKTYTRSYAPWHPRCSASGDVLDHILVAEKALGKFLPSGAVVHHVDGDRRNNHPSNLVICQDQAYHLLLHRRQRVVEMGGDPDTHRQCCTCREIKPFADFNKRSSDKQLGIQGACRNCMRQYHRRYLKDREAA